ncbi:MAG TPA: flagellar basal body-associated FliL family protein [Hyphomicrobium sp.]|nr:flagellar basal body-associated FliL family protein [Hyphomicrobium sp.]
MSMVGIDGKSGDPGQEPQGQPSTLYFIVIVALLTLVAAGIGYFSGKELLSTAQETTAKGDDNAGYLGERFRMESSKLRPLAPIVTNLAGPDETWIRIESSLVFNEVPNDVDALTARITEDIVAFLRTVKVGHIEGAIGFQHLSEDLNDRVRARSDGSVREIIIQGLIVE